MSAATAKARANVSWWSLPGSASSSSRRTPCSHVARSAARLAGAEKLLTAWAAYAGIREDPKASVSAAMLPSTSSTKSVARISASRVMSHAAPQHSARASESSRRDSPATTVSSERSSSRIFA